MVKEPIRPVAIPPSNSLRERGSGKTAVKPSQCQTADPVGGQGFHRKAADRRCQGEPQSIPEEGSRHSSQTHGKNLHVTFSFFTINSRVLAYQSGTFFSLEE